MGEPTGGRRATTPEGGASPSWPGERLGLPETGPGSVASFGRRAVAYVVDSVAANLITLLVVPVGGDPVVRSLVLVGVLVAIYLVLLPLVGQTLGMRLLGLRVTPLTSAAGAPGLRATLVRTALLVLLVPALVWDADSRGLHDKAAGTAVLRTG